MIQLTRTGMTGSADVANLSRQFTREHAFRLPGLLGADVLEMTCARLEQSAWSTRVDGSIAKEASPEAAAPVNALNFAMNTAEFLEFIRSVTGCDAIAYFGGRVYRMAPDADHYDSWHADIGTQRDRLVGMSINLGAQPYEGGVFRLRDESSGVVLCELPNTGLGDAILFRISPDLKHMVTPVVGSEQKTAFAGWFRSGGPGFYESLRASAANLSSTTR